MIQKTGITILHSKYTWILRPEREDDVKKEKIMETRWGP